MLSIAKLSAEQHSYYLSQAAGRVDAVESIGEGLEDYYAGGAEARGGWLGRGARGLGLVGPVEGEALRRVFGGLDPAEGSELRAGRGVVRNAAFDLTFSAPKSVSVLLGIGNDRIQQAVRAGHDRAVTEALGHLERSAAAVRRGPGGERVEPADGFIAAAFRHRTSRAGDPQLHTHVLVANLGRGPDGRWTALDARRIYAHARTASFVYQAVLRSELTCSLGVEWTAVRKGIGEVLGVPKPLLRAFSRRRAEIDAALAARGTSGARAAEAAALATRQAKVREIDSAGLVAAWRAEAARHGLDTERVGQLLDRTAARRVEAGLERIFATLASSTGLTRRSSTFTRRDVLQALCERLPSGVKLDGAGLERAADEFLASRHAVVLLPDTGQPEAAEVFRRRDGRLLPIAREESRYSTPELLAVEQRLIDRVAERRRAGVGVAASDDVAAAIAARPTLSAEQRAMIEHVCRSGDGVSVVVGRAGSGKTYALGAAREAWQAAGHPVVGAAIARRAARELQDGAGIASTSVVALLTSRLPDGCVLVIDEAGMLPTRQLAAVLHAVELARGKLVLVGDHGQLQEIEAGGAFRGLVRRGLAVELTENRRQVNAWERVALERLREGRASEALTLYIGHDRVVVERDEGAARDRLVADWWASGGTADAIMIAHRRADAADLNARARRRMRDGGRLGPDALELAGGAFAVGDHVVIKRNDVARGIANGDRGTVVAVDRRTGGLVLESRGERVSLGAAFLHGRTVHGDPTLLHGYAITAHVAQGSTVDHAFVLAGAGMTRELAYTALSRGRHTNKIYLAVSPSDAREEFGPVAQPGDPLARLVASWWATSASSLAVDVGQPSRDLHAEIDAAEASLHAARTARRELETDGPRWLPGRRGRLAAARADEVRAAEVLRDLRRARAEHAHAARPFVTQEQLDAEIAGTNERIADRHFERSRAQGRGIER